MIFRIGVLISEYCYNDISVLVCHLGNLSASNIQRLSLQIREGCPLSDNDLIAVNVFNVLSQPKECLVSCEIHFHFPIFRIRGI